MPDNARYYKIRLGSLKKQTQDERLEMVRMWNSTFKPFHNVIQCISRYGRCCEDAYELSTSVYMIVHTTITHRVTAGLALARLVASAIGA